MKVLVVDDDLDVRNLLLAFLKKLEVEAAAEANAEDALLALAQISDQFDVVITDDDIPRMRGTELAHHIKEIWPEIRVILMSAREIDKGDADIFIWKPFKLRVLQAALGL